MYYLTNTETFVMPCLALSSGDRHLTSLTISEEIIITGAEVRSLFKPIHLKM